MAAYKVLFVDDEDYIRSMLTAYFVERLDMATADGGPAALELLGRERFDMVVSDINMPDMSGPEFLTEVQRRHPDVKRALLTSSNIDDYVQFARESAVSSIIPKTVPFNFVEVEGIIMGLLTGEIFGLARYLRPDGRETGGKFCVKSSFSAEDVRDQIVAILEAKFKGSGDTKLVLDEILANAIYHAPAAQNGADKYQMFIDVELEPQEYISVELGWDSEKYGISVQDGSGRLTRDIVLSKMERQISGEGYMDDSGRGLHMCRLFADRLVINIERGKRTEIIVMNYLSENYSGHKPLYINEV
jgi:CheY-like chemotaxis protein/anti-sigma regulatory factor (Ser/Thr protein kinase)